MGLGFPGLGFGSLGFGGLQGSSLLETLNPKGLIRGFYKPRRDFGSFLYLRLQ